MTTAPAADQVRLLTVQDLDTHLDQLAHRRRTAPVLQTITDLEARATDLASALVTSRTAASDLRRELSKAESDVEQVRGRAQRDGLRLDAGQVSAKDVQALTSEIASLGRRQEVLEEIELDVMERLEAHTGVLAELESAHATVAAELTAAQAERDAVFAALDDEVAQLSDERTRAADGLDPTLLALYERLRGHLSGRGAATLQGRQCLGCRMELGPVDLEEIRRAADDQVARCPECGRILVRTAP